MDLMTAREVADFLTVARTTLYVLVARHNLPQPLRIAL